jgi:hypothetical protein
MTMPRTRFGPIGLVNLNNPNGSLTAGTFGRVTSVRQGAGPRVVQIGAKYIF